MAGDCARLGLLVANAVVLIWFGWPAAALFGLAFLWWATVAYAVNRWTRKG